MFLEQRIRRIAQWPQERRQGRAAFLATTALLLFATALSARDPLRTGSAPDNAAATPADIPGSASLLAAIDTPPQKPTFTPMTVRPELLNRADVGSALERNYPPLLRDAGIDGRAEVWFYLDTLGAVQRTLIAETSGYPALDSAALAVARVMRFSPAYNRDERVSVWVRVPIVFTLPKPDGGAALQGAQRADPPPRADSRREATPMTKRPELVNRDVVRRELVDAYPPELRDAGIGGSPYVWFHIDERGRVVEAEVSRSSGRFELDAAALQVARVMQFSPAERDGEVVAVWVEIPIRFTAR